MSQQPRKGTIDFTNPPNKAAPPVFVGPGVNPTVAAHNAGVAARRGLPKYDTPTSGSNKVSIPLLTGHAEPGKTMAEQAEGVNSLPAHVQVARNVAAAQGMGAGPSIIKNPPQMGGGAPAAFDLRPTDMLPDEAARDPEFRQGPSCMVAITQRALAYKYGIVRNGERIPPQRLAGQVPGQGKAGLRPETVQNLKDMMEDQQRRQLQGLPETEKDTEEAAQKAVEEISKAKIGAESEEDVKSRLAQMGFDELDIGRIRDQMFLDVLRNPNQRDIIESRLKPLEIGDLIQFNRITQLVPIIPDKFEVTFLSSTGMDDLELKRLLMVEAKKIEVTERYLTDKFAFMVLACGVHSINNSPAPQHLDTKQRFDEKNFWNKYDWVMDRPLHMLAALHNNYIWFEMRVRRLFAAEPIKNG